MRQLFRIELERAFHNKRFIAVLIFEAVLIVYDLVVNGLHTCNVTIPAMLQYASSGKVSIMPGVYSTWIGLHHGQTRTILYAVLPILAAFPYGDSVYWDEKNHYYYNMITRIHKRNYYLTKLLVLFISGGVCAVFPFVLDFLCNAMILPFGEVVPCLSYYMGDAFVLSEMFYQMPWLYVIIYMLYVFISFGILNTVCFLASYLFSNRYVVMITPFCVYFFGLILYSFVAKMAVPWVYFRLNDVLKRDVLQIVIQLTIYCLLLVVCIFCRIRKGKDML